MEIVKRVFDKALVIKLKSRTDNRGPMTVAYGEEFAARVLSLYLKKPEFIPCRRKERSLGFTTVRRRIRWISSLRLFMAEARTT